MDDWITWDKKIRQVRLTGLALLILEGSGPLRGLLAQGLLATLPFFNQSPSVKAFAEMLEDSESCGSFANYLRGGKQ
jgi:hypothetical protein